MAREYDDDWIEDDPGGGGTMELSTAPAEEPVSYPGGSPTFDERIREGPTNVPDFTSGSDPNPGGRFPTGSYLTPDEARERNVGWVARPGEPQDLGDPYHYQTQDESTARGRDWATQPAIASGNARHAGFTPEMTADQIRALGRTTPDEISAWLTAGGDPRMMNPRGSQFNPSGGASGRPAFQNGSPLFDDPASRLIEDYALDRFGQRINPDPNSGTALFESYARQLIETLKQPVNSPQDEAVLKGKAINGIELERQATKQRWVEEISRRGLSPRDGPYLDGLMKIDEYFNQARNTFETEFAKDAIAQTRQQRFQVLDTAGQLAGSEEGRLREAGTYAAMPKQLQDNSFQQGLQLVGAGGSPQSILQSAMEIAQMGQNQQAYDSQRKSQLAAGLMQWLGYMFGG